MKPHNDIVLLGPGRDNRALTRALLVSAMQANMGILLTPSGKGDGEVAAQLVEAEASQQQDVITPMVFKFDCATETEANKWETQQTFKTTARERSHPNQPFWKRHKGRRW